VAEDDEGFEPQEERRNYDRSRLIVDVFFDGKDVTGVASTKDISPGGLYMNTQDEIPEGTLLLIRLPFRQDAQVVCNAVVVYSNPGRGVGLNTLIVAIAFTVGPSVASGILAIAPWPWLFAVNVPLGVLAVVLALPSLPHTTLSTHTFDLRSAVLNAAAFGLLILAIGEGAHQAQASVVGLELAAAIVCGLFLLKRELSHPAPMLPVDLFRAPAFALSAVTAVCAFAAQGFGFVALPFLLQSHLGFVAVHPDHRRRGIARLLVVATFQATGTLRMDLITDSAEDFYASFPHKRMAGFRIYPGATD